MPRGPGLLGRRGPSPTALEISGSGAAAGSTYRAGMWTTPPHASSTGLPTNGEMVVSPLYLPRAGSITDLACECVTTPGGTGSVVRMGVYADDGTGYPGALLVDAGTVDTTTTGVKTLTLGTALSLAAGRYWLAGVGQGAPAPNPTMRLDGTTTPRAGILAATAAIALQNAIVSYRHTGVTGALPGTFVTTPSNITYSIRMSAKLG